MKLPPVHTQTTHISMSHRALRGHLHTMSLLDAWKNHRARTRSIRVALEAADEPSRLDNECRSAAEWRAATARLQAAVDEAWPEQRARIYDGLPQQRRTGE